MYPTNLKQFREWLKLPGATLVMLDAGKYAAQWPPVSLTAAMAGRPVERVQTNCFALKSGNPDRPNPSYCYFGKASEWAFDGDKVSHGIGTDNVMTYRMEIRQESAHG